MKKIALLAPEFYPIWGGVGTYSCNLAKGLENKVDIHIFTPYRGFDETQIKRKLGLKRAKIIFVSRAFDYFFYNLFFQIFLVFKFLKMDKKYDYDLIHSANLVHMPDLFLGFFTRKKIITTVHTTVKSQLKGILAKRGSLSYVEFFNILFYPFLKICEWIYLKRNRELIFVSNYSADSYIISKDNYHKHIINNGIDFKIFNNKISRKESLKKVKKAYPYLPMRFFDRKVIFFCGRLIKQKGNDIMKQMINDKRLKDCNFLVIGNGNKIKSKNVVQLEYVDNKMLPFFLKLVDVYVLPSYNENFPFTLIEAMSMEVPCVASDVGGVKEILGKNGILVKRGDLDGYVKGVLSILNKEKHFNSLRKEVRHLDAEIMCRKTLSLYESILEHKPHLCIIHDIPAEVLEKKGILERAEKKFNEIAKKYEVTFYSIKSGSKHNVKYNIKGAKIIEIRKLFWIFLPFFLFYRNRQKKIDLLKSYKPFYTSFLALIFTKLFGIKQITTLHGDWESNRKNYGLFSRVIKSALEKIVIRNSNVVFCTSHNLREYSLKKGAKKVYVIPTWGCDIDIFHKIKKNKDKNKNKKINILFAGRIEPQKNIELLIKASRILRDSGKKIQVNLVGPINNNSYYSRLKIMIEKARLERSIIFKGGIQQKELSKYYSTADCIVLTSNMEGLSHTILEGLLFNKPIVAKNIGDTSRLIRNGKNGYAYDIDNPILIAKLIEQASKLKVKDKYGYSLIKNNYSMSESNKKELKALMRESTNQENENSSCSA